MNTKILMEQIKLKLHTSTHADTKCNLLIYLVGTLTIIKLKFSQEIEKMNMLDVVGAEVAKSRQTCECVGVQSPK